MELGKTETVGVLDDQGIGVGQVDACLDDGGADEDIDLLIAEGAKRAVEQGLVKPGDTLVVTAGLPVGVTGTTNFIRVIKA